MADDKAVETVEEAPAEAEAPAPESAEKPKGKRAARKSSVEDELDALLEAGHRWSDLELVTDNSGKLVRVSVGPDFLG